MEFKVLRGDGRTGPPDSVNITRMEFKTVTITTIAVAPVKVNAAIIENRLMFYFLYYVIILR